MRLTNLKRQQQRHNCLLLDLPIDQSHNTTSRCTFDQTKPENESRYPRTLLAKIQRNCLTEMNSQDRQQHERDDSSKKETELHTHLVNTQSKAPRAQENESVDERWKRAKAAQTTTKTTWKLRRTDDPQAMAQESPTWVSKPRYLHSGADVSRMSHQL